MVGKVEEVRNETEEILKKFLKNNQVPINDDESQKEGTSHPIDRAHITLDAEDSQNPLVDHPEMVEGKVEEAKETPKVDTVPSGDTDAQVEEKEKIKEEIHTEQELKKDEGNEEAEKDKDKEEIPEKVDNVHILADTQNVQIEGTVNVEPAITDTAPSGEATDAEEDTVKDNKPSKRKGEESSRELVVRLRIAEMGGPPIRHEPIYHELLSDGDYEPLFRASG
ncbi:structure-specific endonuclease subunit SLX4-like [Cryptomeria japonica]|uniref:structure-specific endonuclease subunit SLX4-like n=1 Tax=Cryptomeria japonica TaxID=3369 RepID=UPI0027DA1781|nr:structure-specific endonuclease subunit SLX4-like [Cryptomeria japonica]